MSKRSPDQWPKHRIATTFLRVPQEDWPAISMGHKTEFRLAGSPAWAACVKTPTPVVAYATGPIGKVKDGLAGVRTEGKLMLLEGTFNEPLGIISAESLAREGFPDLAHFRRYWIKRTQKRFRPMEHVQAFIVRPVVAEDHDYLGRLLLARLYGEHL